ncbi:hypothetical protein MUK42_28119 [Musa troglodytarum]|uniref:Uncharacterized protein n=1 Tax=Musa troglodytarum TaxID=320322 RepID=A0A9E7JLX4_9LILI|nr:hypothetical protein MUK42_28119 [Musa troglodytarum]
MDPRSATPYPSQVVCPDSAFDWLPLAAFLFLTQLRIPVSPRPPRAVLRVLFTVLNLAFAWRAAEILPPLLAVAMAGFYVLIIYPHADDDPGRSMIPSAEQNV